MKQVSKMRVILGTICLILMWHNSVTAQRIGQESAFYKHLVDGLETSVSLNDLLIIGATDFRANWTSTDGAGRPLTKGTGRPLTDSSRPLTGLRAFNRFSGPDANSCAGCHNYSLRNRRRGG